MNDLLILNKQLMVCQSIRPKAVTAAAIGLVLGSLVGESMAGHKGSIIAGGLGAGLFAMIALHYDHK